MTNLIVAKASKELCPHGGDGSDVFCVWRKEHTIRDFGWRCDERCEPRHDAAEVSDEHGKERGR